MTTKHEKTQLEFEAFKEKVIKRLSEMKAEDLFPEKNKRALENLIREGLLKP